MPAPWLVRCNNIVVAQYTMMTDILYLLQHAPRLLPHGWCRHQHGGPGFVTGGEADLAGWKIIGEMVRHIWPRDHPALKARVVGALGLLVGAKVRDAMVS